MSNTTPGGQPEHDHRGDAGALDEDAAHEETVVVERPSGEETVIRDTTVESSSSDSAHGPATIPASPDEPPAAGDRSDEVDAAIERANASPHVPSGETEAAPGHQPSYGYEPSAPGAYAPAPEYAAAAPTQHAIYVQAPEPPATKGNRAFGVLVGAIAAIVFALLFAGVSYLLLQIARGSMDDYVGYLTSFAFWIPVVAFFVGFIVLAAIINRGGWWAYVIFGLLVGVFVYFSFVGGALLTVQAWTLTIDEAVTFIGQRWLDPRAILAGVIAREVTIWFGAWLARRGRMVTIRNREAVAEYERQLAAGPQLTA